VFFDVMNNQHWRSKYDSFAGHSDLAITPALDNPSCPRTVRIDDHPVGELRFDKFWRFGTKFADMETPVKFHRFGSQQFHLFE